MNYLRNVNPGRVCLGALVCLACLACFSGVVSPLVMLVTVAVEVAIWRLWRLENTGRGNQAASARGGFNSRSPDHYTPYREPITGMH